MFKTLAMQHVFVQHKMCIFDVDIQRAWSVVTHRATPTRRDSHFCHFWGRKSWVLGPRTCMLWRRKCGRMNSRRRPEKPRLRRAVQRLGMRSKVRGIGSQRVACCRYILFFNMMFIFSWMCYFVNVYIYIYICVYIYIYIFMCIYIYIYIYMCIYICVFIYIYIYIYI